MTQSNYMPDVKIEVAFNAGFGTPAADRIWTDVSEWVELHEGFSITGGRQNERSVADANQLSSLVLDNSDGRFTAERPASPYYPNVKLDRPIRVTATPVDGPASVRFLGYVNEWPLEWDGTDAYAKAVISASSRLARLGYTAGLKSIVEQTILAEGPAAYYTLSEAAGATQANDSSGNKAPPLTLAGDPLRPVVFGNAIGPGTDSLTALQFVGGQHLVTQFPPQVPASTAWSVEFFFSSDLPSGDGYMLNCFTSSGAGATPRIKVSQSTGELLADFALASLSSPNSVADEGVHHVAMTGSIGGSLILYVDGVSVDTASTLVTFPTFEALEVGAMEAAHAISHLAIYPHTELTAAQVATHASAGLTGFVGEPIDERLERYASYANIPAAEIDAATGSTTMAHVDTTDQHIVDLLRVVETTEGGVLYDERDGTLTLHGRAHRYVVVPAFTLDFAQQHIESDYKASLDRTYIVNDVSAANIAGTFSARVFDAQSRDVDYGPMTVQLATASDDDDAPLQAASWMVFAYKDPRSRVASCSVDALAQVDKNPNCSEVMSATVGTKIRVSNHPSQAKGSTETYFVEGWTETYGPESLRLTWNLSPSSPWDQTLILGDPYRGFLGVNPLAY